MITMMDNPAMSPTTTERDSRSASQVARSSTTTASITPTRSATVPAIRE